MVSSVSQAPPFLSSPFQYPFLSKMSSIPVQTFYDKLYPMMMAETGYCLTQEVLDGFAIQLNSTKTPMEQFKQMYRQRIAECDDVDEKAQLVDDLIETSQLFTEPFDHYTVFLPTGNTTGTVMDFRGDTIIMALCKMHTFYQGKFPVQDLFLIAFGRNEQGVITLDLELHPSH